MTDRTWRCSTCANEHDETMPHDTDRASAEGLPRPDWEEEARRYAENADYWRVQLRHLERLIEDRLWAHALPYVREMRAAALRDTGPRPDILTENDGVPFLYDDFDPAIAYQRGYKAGAAALQNFNNPEGLDDTLDRASAEGLRRYRAIINANGAMEFIEDPDGALVTYADVVALRDTGPRPDSRDIDVERLAEAMRPLFDGPESVHLERLGWWEGDLLALTRKNIATRVARRYALARLSTPRTETSDHD